MHHRRHRCKNVPEVPNVNKSDDAESAVEEVDPDAFEARKVGYICEDCGKTWPTNTLPEDADPEADHKCPKCRDGD